MRPLSTFATGDRPIRASGLKSLVSCPWKHVMLFLAEAALDDEAGPAADTGSATHKAIAAWHKGADTATAMGVMKAHTGEYPRADLIDAAGLFLKYTADPRNAVELLLCEEKVYFAIQPAEDDPTGAPIEVEGTVDQVRLVDGRAKVWDVKTSTKDPTETSWNSQMQVAAYCIGASVKLNRQVDPGGIIMPRQYKDRSPATAPVFWNFPWKFEDIEHILAPVRHAVSMIRRGVVMHVPGADNCKYCHAKTPDLCLPRKKRALL